MSWHLMPRQFHVYMFNPLRFIHAYVGTPEDETSVNRDTNWLPEGVIQERNDRALAVTDYLIWEAEQQITELIEDFARSRGDSTLGIYQGAALSLLEVAVDFGAEDPLAAIDDLAPYFRQHIRQTHLSGYRPTTTSYETHEDDSRMVHGRPFRHERYKAYVKTNRRLRIECEVKPGAFIRLGINRSISDEGNSFRVVYGHVASHCIETANSILECFRGTTGRPVERNVLDLLLAIGRVCRDPERARTFAQTLAHTGRVTSSFGYRYLRPFIDHGLIHRTAHGIYAPVPAWQSAVAALRNHLGNLLGGAAR